MAAGNDEADSGKFRSASGEMSFEKNGVNVAFEMIHGDERLAERHGQGFAVGDADDQRADEAGAESNGDGVRHRGVRFSLALAASRTTGTMRRRCSREASSGTTPPYLR